MDKDLEATALRETEEEIGISSERSKNPGKNESISFHQQLPDYPCGRIT